MQRLHQSGNATKSTIHIGNVETYISESADFICWNSIFLSEGGYTELLYLYLRLKVPFVWLQCNIDDVHAPLQCLANVKKESLPAICVQPITWVSTSMMSYFYITNAAEISPTSKLLADQLATNGYTVMMPELFPGNSWNGKLMVK